VAQATIATIYGLASNVSHNHASGRFKTIIDARTIWNFLMWPVAWMAVINGPAAQSMMAEANAKRKNPTV
jgi:hypothetical protein